MNRVLFFAMLLSLMIAPAIAQPEPTVTPEGAMSFMTQVFEFFRAYAPWLIVIALTQLLKKSILVKLTDWLKRLLSIVIPFIISALTWLLFSIGRFDAGTWLQSSASSWVLAVFGYDMAKAVVKAAQAIYKGFKGEAIE